MELTVCQFKRALYWNKRKIPFPFGFPSHIMRFGLHHVASIRSILNSNIKLHQLLMPPKASAIKLITQMGLSLTVLKLRFLLHFPNHIILSGLHGELQHGPRLRIRRRALLSGHLVLLLEVQGDRKRGAFVHAALD